MVKNKGSGIADFGIFLFCRHLSKGISQTKPPLPLTPCDSMVLLSVFSEGLATPYFSACPWFPTTLRITSKLFTSFTSLPGRAQSDSCLWLQPHHIALLYSLTQRKSGRPSTSKGRKTPKLSYMLQRSM